MVGRLVLSQYSANYFRQHMDLQDGFQVANPISPHRNSMSFESRGRLECRGTLFV